ncbi:MAG: hypothetical protein ABSE64_05725 [Vulcanimicrobiaceae bacterium]|jgi:hypothetical protein
MRILALLLVVVSNLIAGCSRDLTDPEEQKVHAAAEFYAPGPFQRTFAISGRMTLPLVPRNESWYALSFMVVSKPDTVTGNSEFWQVGLIRWRENYRLESFLAGRTKDGPFFFRSLGVLEEGSHLVRLAGSHGKLQFILDGGEIASDDYDKYFEGREPYLQIMDEVSKSGDQVAGRLSEVEIRHDDGSVSTLSDSTCSLNDRGVYWQRTGPTEFAAYGVFGRSDARAFGGNCSWYQR